MALQTFTVVWLYGGLAQAQVTVDDVALDVTALAWVNNSPDAITVTVTQGNHTKSGTAQPGNSGNIAVNKGWFTYSQVTGDDGLPGLQPNFLFEVDS